MNHQICRDFLKREFPGLRDKTFLDSACVGLVPQRAKDDISSFLRMAQECPARDVSLHHIEMDRLKDLARAQAAKLVGASKESTVLIESTTHGLNIAANSLKLGRGDEVVICESEYLQVAIPFLHLEKSAGICIKKVPVPDDRSLTLSDFTAKCSSHTKAIVVSSVQWCTGDRVFSKSLGEYCKENKIFLIVDGIQELGALHCDSKERYCDFYIAGGHKWLNAPFGCGVMYVSQRAMSLNPNSFGYLNIIEPRGGFKEFFQDPSQSPFTRHNFVSDASKFGIGGTGNYPGAIGLGASARLLNQTGTLNVEKKVIGLARFLREKLRQLGVAKLWPIDDENLSGITVFRLNDDFKFERSLVESLLEKRILVSIRFTNGLGGIRISTHFFNSEEDILKLVHAIECFRR